MSEMSKQLTSHVLNITLINCKSADITDIECGSDGTNKIFDHL